MIDKQTGVEIIQELYSLQNNNKQHINKTASMI